MLKKIQFQKGLRLKEFLKLYGTKEDCRNHLFKLRWPSVQICPQCDYSHYYNATERNLYQCTNCKHQSFLISNTIPESSKLPLTTWFSAIYFITQEKHGLSAIHLQRLLGISVDIAFRMRQKIQHVMKIVDDSLRFENLVELDGLYCGGKKSGKCDCCATGKSPFLAEFSNNDTEHPIHMLMSKVKAFTFSEIKRWSIKYLNENCVVITNAFRPFSGIFNFVDLHIQ